MQTITQTIYEFNELSEKSKKIALEQYHDKMQNNFEIEYYIFDDCYLFEPKHEQLINLFSTEYSKLTSPIIGNTRKNIYFNDYYLKIEDAIQINNDKLFLLWLKIPLQLHDKVYYTFSSTRNGNTKINFVENDSTYQFTNDELNILENSSSIFNEHINQISNDIQNNIDFYFSDSNMIEQITENEVYFFKNGNIYKY